MNAKADNVMGSYMEMRDGTQVELNIPNGAETGFKLVSGFTVPVGGGVDFTLDSDLRKSITRPPLACLRPCYSLLCAWWTTWW